MRIGKLSAVYLLSEKCGFGFFLDAQMDDQDLNEPIAKVALLKGKQIYFCKLTCIICIYIFLPTCFFNQMCIEVQC